MIIYREDLKQIYEYIGKPYKEKCSWNLLMVAISKLNTEDIWEKLDNSDLSTYLVIADKASIYKEVLGMMEAHKIHELTKIKNNNNDK